MTEPEEIERGRQLVESGEDPPAMLDRLARIRYFESQRELVRRRGCCGHGEVWISPMGRVCCKHTRDPCPRQALALVLELFSIINRGETDGQRVGNSRWAKRKHHPGR